MRFTRIMNAEAVAQHEGLGRKGVFWFTSWCSSSRLESAVSGLPKLSLVTVFTRAGSKSREVTCARDTLKHYSKLLNLAFRVLAYL